MKGYQHDFSKLSTILFCCCCFPQIQEPEVATELSLGPALASLLATVTNLDNKFWNSKVGSNTGIVLKMMVKATAGHPARVPTDSVLVALGAAPVPVGTALPPAAIMAGQTWTRGRIASLTTAQLNDLEWFYNEQFVGASVGDRRSVFLAFLGT